MTRPTVDFDHHSAVYAANPDEHHAAQREECPVAWSEHYGGFWALSRYSDVREVSTCPERFSSRHDVPNDGVAFTGITIPEQSPFPMPPVESDAPHHREYRKILNPAFSPEAVDKLRPVIQQIVDWCIDQHVESGAIDFVDHLGSPVPAMVTMYLMGIELDEWESWAEPLHHFVAVARDDPARADVDEKTMALIPRILDNVARRRQQPTGGVINALIDGRIGGCALDDVEIASTVFVLLGAGVDTTTALLSGVFHHLDGDRSLRTAILDRPDGIQTSCEEFLRYLSPNPTEARTVVTDTHIGNTPVAAGERILVNWYAANHDPSAFSDPDTVDITRKPNRHVAFGMGVHRCVGSHLARAIYQITISTVLRRLPDYRLDHAEIVPYADRSMVNGFVRMPGVFTPGPRIGAQLPVNAMSADQQNPTTAEEHTHAQH
jgi:cytochrome P450